MLQTKKYKKHRLTIAVDLYYEDGQIGFTITNKENGNILFKTPMLLENVEVANILYKDLFNTYLTMLLVDGGKLIERYDNYMVVDIPIEEAELNLLGGIICNKKTNKFGFAILTKTGIMLILPKKWYDKPNDALETAVKDREDLMTNVNAMGYNVVESLSTDKEMTKRVEGLKKLSPEELMQKSESIDEFLGRNKKKVQFNISQPGYSPSMN